jgi:hypothetical protein
VTNTPRTNQCDGGACCTSSCRFASFGFICRNAVSICDGVTSTLGLSFFVSFVVCVRFPSHLFAPTSSCRVVLRVLNRRAQSKRRFVRHASNSSSSNVARAPRVRRTCMRRRRLYAARPAAIAISLSTATAGHLCGVIFIFFVVVRRYDRSEK